MVRAATVFNICICIPHKNQGMYQCLVYILKNINNNKKKAGCQLDFKNTICTFVAYIQVLMAFNRL